VIRLIRDARAKARRDDGLTLIEMIVSMVIMSVLLGAVSTIFLATTKAVNANRHRMSQANSARVAIESVARALRQAVLPSQDVANGTCVTVDGGGTCLSAFIQGTPTSLQFYSNVDNPVLHATSGTNNSGPRKVSYSIDAANNLVQVIQQPDTHAWDNYNWTYSSCATVPANCRQSVLAANITQVGGDPLFTYYQSGTKLTGSTFDADALKRVNSVDIELSVQEDGRSSGSAPTTYIQRVALQNVDTYISQAGS
jgi:prepilin-type N-terminal cleavage/methylation domain-containing protein